MVVYKFPTSTGTQRAFTISSVSRGFNAFPREKREWRVRLLLLYGVEPKGPNAGPLFFGPDSLAMFALALKTLGSIPFEIA
jgi:hypothetical protein